MNTTLAPQRLTTAFDGAPPGNGVDVLVVEDNPCDVELILEALRLCGVSGEVAVTRDGQEALDFLFGSGAWAGRDARPSPRLVLLDLKMPRVSGHEVLRKIRADASTRRIPVVIFTASLEQRDIVEAYELGANSYIVKPFDFEQFSETLSKLSSYWLTLNQPPQ